MNTQLPITPLEALQEIVREEYNGSYSRRQLSAIVYRLQGIAYRALKTKEETKLPITYLDYTITAGEHTNFEFVSNNYDGPGDNRLGTSDTLDDCYTQIDEQIITRQEREIGILEKQIERFKKQADEDVKSLLEASINREEDRKEIVRLHSMLTNREATIEVLTSFVENAIKTFEYKFESDEGCFNYEQMQAYVDMNAYMLAKSGKVSSPKLRQVLDRMNEMAA